MTNKVVKVADIGIPDKGNRIYPEEVMSAAIEKASMPIIGMLGAPDGPTVPLTKASHAVEQLYIEDGSVFAKISTLKTPAGQIAEQLMAENLASFKLVGSGNIAEDGTVSNFSIVTVSIVDPDTAV